MLKCSFCKPQIHYNLYTLIYKLYVHIICFYLTFMLVLRWGSDGVARDNAAKQQTTGQVYILVL